MSRARSRWRDDRLWRERVENDRRTLRERLTDDENGALGGIVELFENDPDFSLRFLVVYGSRARTPNQADPDCATSYETNTRGRL